MEDRTQWWWLFGFFVTASILLAVGFVFYWILRVTLHPLIVWSVLALVGFAVASMLVLAVLAQDASIRWASVGLIGTVALMFSALTILGIGFLVAPFALILMVAATFLLAWNNRFRCPLIGRRTV